MTAYLVPKEIKDYSIMNHVTVYREAGDYAGWPANYGIWSWGNEIVTGFTLGSHSNDGGFHFRDKALPFITMQARSMDGGTTWECVPAPLAAPGNVAISADEHMNIDLGPVDSRVNPPKVFDDTFDFSNPDFAVLMARTGIRVPCESYFYTSNDRCNSWLGPYSFPMFGLGGIAARTDILPDSSDPDKCIFLLTATKPDGDQGRVFSAETKDSGKSFQFLSWLGEFPEGIENMPSSLRLPSGRILTALRCRSSIESKGWIDLLCSDDDGITWNTLSRPVHSTGSAGNPPHMLHLSDGRLCLIYGYRGEGAGLRYSISSDEGISWDREIILRDDAGNHDVGYPRAIERPDGNVVAVYYHNDLADGERYIAATIWKP